MGDTRSTGDGGFVWLVCLAVFVVVIVGIPVGLIVGGLQERTRTSPVPGGVTTTGEVVGDRSDPVSGRGGGSEYAEIQFTARNGESYEFETPQMSNAPDVGTTVKVSYDPNDPNHATDISIGSLHWLGYFIAGLVVLALEAFWGYWQLRKRRKNRSTPP